MPNIKEFDTGNLALHPTEVGVDARAATARRIGMFANQQAGAVEQLASETNRLAGQTQQLGRETQQLGGETEREGAIKGQALNDIGRRVGSAIDVAGSAAVKYLDHQQISHGTATFATLMQNATDSWNETAKNADPNDPTVAKKFMDGLDAQLEKFKGDGFYTENSQAWAEAHTAALRTHFAEKTSADMATLAGQAAVVNTQQTINSLSNTVHSDPSSLDFSLAALRSTTEGMISTSPNLTGVKAGAVRSEILQKGAESIVKSAAVGYIEKNGKMPDWATDPKYAPYINGAELKQFETAARVQAKSFVLADKQAQLAQRQLDDQAVHVGTNKILSDNVRIDPTNGRPIISPKIYQDALDLARKYPNAPSASTAARTIMDWGEAQQSKDMKSVDNPEVVKNLSDRLFDPTNPVTPIDLMRARTKGDISDHTYIQLNGMMKELEETPLKGPVYQDTMKAAHDQLVMNVPSIPGKDDVGTTKYAQFVQAFIPQYLAKSRAGTLEPNALDVNDPKSMISQAMKPFKRTVKERMDDYVAGIAGLGGAATENGVTRKVGDVPVPAALGGIAALQYNAAAKQWRDQTSGIVYDSAGQPVKR